MINVAIISAYQAANLLHTMPTFSHLPSGKWRVQIRRKGIYRAATFETKREASAWATAIEAQVVHIGNGGFAPVPKTATVADLIDKYEDTFSKTHGKSKTATLAMLKRELGHVRLVTLNPVVMRDFIDHRQAAGAGGSTIAGDLSCFSAVLKWAKHARQLDVNDRLAVDARAGLAHRGLSTRSMERDREPTDTELERIYKHWEGLARQKIPMRVICEFALATGMRQAEICRLEIEDVDRQQKTVVIRNRKDPRNKIGNNQTVPLLPDAWAIVEPLLGGRESGYIFNAREDSVSAAFTRACQDVKPPIVDLHFHDLRHRATAQFFRMGLGIPQVALLTGHKTWAMLRRYTKITASDVHAAFNKPGSPAPDKAGQQGDSLGDSSARTV